MHSLAKLFLHLFSDNSPFVLFSQTTMTIAGYHEAVLAGKRFEGGLIWNGSREDVFSLP